MKLATLLSLGLLVAGCATGGAEFQAFPMAPHRPVEVQERGLRVDRAIEEFMDIRGLAVRRGGATLSGVTVTEWAAAAGIENGEPPIAECPARRSSEGEAEYRVRYRFTLAARTGSRTLFVEAQWQTLRGAGLEDRPRWVDCPSTGIFERNTQDQLLIRARMLSG